MRKDQTKDRESTVHVNKQKTEPWDVFFQHDDDTCCHPHTIDIIE